ncbi:MAG TPA: pyridoxal-phosphate dependent enzyme [Thermoanaerobaculia bacterium]|nr:pyridoxal-phosphate dependent enzyme [Thermoanaerobaculia bacterium]
MTALDMRLVLEARRALDGRIRRTPIEPSPALSERAGVPVFLKLENLQLTGSFKIRGAFFVLSRLSGAPPEKGIVTCSAGNHGKAVAHVARELGIPAEIHVPRSVDESKYRAIVALGANVVRSEHDGFDDTERIARAAAEGSGRPFLTAFDDEAILAANGGTLAAEVLEDCPEARAFLVPVGGAGLAGGFAFYAKTALPDASIVGCQHALSPALALSLERGEAVLTLPPVATAAGGLEGGIGRTGFSYLRGRLGGVALLTEEEIFEAVRFLLDRHQYLVEPSAAVTVAALLTGKAGRLDGPAVAVLSGRNVALPTLRRILAA